jgi:ABC-type multidrug transport system fused ATPase/permease subunit
MVITLPMYRKVQSLLDTILSATRENLTGVRVIRAFGMEETEKREFNEKNSALNAMQKFVGGISALMNPVTFVIVNTATLCLLYTGAVRVDEGIITRGQVVALVNYMSQILVELVKLANLIVLLTRAMSCSQRINSVLMMEGREEELMVDEHPFINEDEPADGLWGEAKAGGASVEFKNVWFAYHDTGHQDEKTDPEGSIDQDERYALKDVSFSAGSGEIIGVIGGTGSGKSTIACLIPGFFYPDRGQVLVDGKCTEDYGLRDLRASVGIALQKSVLFSGTIRENLLWGSPTATDDELVAALKSAQAWEFVKDRRGQLDAILSQGGRDLSGGQKQRLNIARALVGDKQIVILDDSSSALDYATDAALKKEVRSLSKEKGTTVFIISQRTASISHADRIIVLDEGRVAGTGTHDELLESCPEYREIHESQTH